MSNCDFFIVECLIGEQSSGHPQEVQVGHWMENFQSKWD